MFHRCIQITVPNISKKFFCSLEKAPQWSIGENNQRKTCQELFIDCLPTLSTCQNCHYFLLNHISFNSFNKNSFSTERRMISSRMKSLVWNFLDKSGCFYFSRREILSFQTRFSTEINDGNNYSFLGNSNFF